MLLEHPITQPVLALHVLPPLANHKQAICCQHWSALPFLLMMLQVPYFNAPMFLQNKTQIGRIEEIFGGITNTVRLLSLHQLHACIVSLDCINISALPSYGTPIPACDQTAVGCRSTCDDSASQVLHKVMSAVLRPIYSYHFTF